MNNIKKRPFYMLKSYSEEKSEPIFIAVSETGEIITDSISQTDFDLKIDSLESEGREFIPETPNELVLQVKGLMSNTKIVVPHDKKKDWSPINKPFEKDLNEFITFKPKELERIGECYILKMSDISSATKKNYFAVNSLGSRVGDLFQADNIDELKRRMEYFKLTINETVPDEIIYLARHRLYPGNNIVPHDKNSNWNSNNIKINFSQIMAYIEKVTDSKDFFTQYEYIHGSHIDPQINLRKIPGNPTLTDIKDILPNLSKALSQRSRIFNRIKKESEETARKKGIKVERIDENEEVDMFDDRYILSRNGRITLELLRDVLIESSDPNDSCLLKFPQFTSQVDIGIESCPLDESRIRNVGFNWLGVVPYKTNKKIGTTSHYLAFSTGEFSPAGTEPYQIGTRSFLRKFDDYMVLFALIIPPNMAQGFIKHSKEGIKMPRDRVEALEEGITKNPFEYIMMKAQEKRSRGNHAMIFSRDIIESSIIICDEAGNLYSLPKKLEAKRGMDLSQGLVEITANTLKTKVSGEMGLEFKLFEDLISENPQLLTPAYINNVREREINLRGMGPKGYGGTSFYSKDPVKNSSARKAGGRSN